MKQTSLIANLLLQSNAKATLLIKHVFMSIFLQTCVIWSHFECFQENKHYTRNGQLGSALKIMTVMTWSIQT